MTATATAAVTAEGPTPKATTSTRDEAANAPYLGSFWGQQLRAMPWRIILNFMLGAVLVFGWPPLNWARKLFDPAYQGFADGALLSDLVSYIATFENTALGVVLTALAIYALFASTVIFCLKGLFLQWYSDAMQLGEVRRGWRKLVRFPLRVIEHGVLWLSVALTWLALGICYRAIEPSQTFGFDELWAHYQGVWEMFQSPQRLQWQAGFLAVIAVPSALADLYLKRRFIHRVRTIVDAHVAR